MTDWSNDEVEYSVCCLKKKKKRFGATFNQRFSRVDQRPESGDITPWWQVLGQLLLLVHFLWFITYWRSWCPPPFPNVIGVIKGGSEVESALCNRGWGSSQEGLFDAAHTCWSSVGVSHVANRADRGNTPMQPMLSAVISSMNTH